MKRSTSIGVALGATAMLATPALPAFAAAAKAGGACKTLGQKSGSLTCVKQGTKRIWQAAAAATTAPPAPQPGAAAPSPAPAAGLKPTNGFDGTTITIGALANVSVNDQFPASRNFADGGRSLYAGFKSVIDRVNAQGGIAGKYKLKIAFKDTYYTPSEAIKAYAEIKNQVVMIGHILGTPQAQAMSKLLLEDNLVAMPISLDYAWVNDPSYLPAGGTYQQQAINIADWAVKEGGYAGKTFCILSIANNAYGDAGDAGFNYAATKLNLKIGAKLKTSTNPATAAALKDAKCEVVLATISGEAHTPQLLAETAKLDYFPVFMGPSPTFASRSVVPANSAAFAKQVVIVGDAAQWGDESNPGTKQHMADLKAYAREQIDNPNPASQWGSASGEAVVALLEKAVALGSLDKAGIKTAMNQLGSVGTKGMLPTWNYVEPAKRVSPASSFIYNVDIATRGGLKVLKPYESEIAKTYKP